MNKKVLLPIVGAFFGIPLSYLFQSEIVKSKIGGFDGYIKHFDSVLKEESLRGNVILSIVIFAFIGGVIGYFLDKNEAEKGV